MKFLLFAAFTQDTYCCRSRLFKHLYIPGYNAQSLEPTGTFKSILSLRLLDHT